LVRAFCSHTDEQEHNQLRITLACVNLLALLLFHKGKELFRKLDSSLLRKFVGRVSSMDVGEVLQANPRIESSVVYLLTLIKLVPESTHPANLRKYRNSVLQFLQCCSSSEKISFNILKLVFDLQKKNVFEQRDYQRWRVEELVTQRIRGQSAEVQVLGYNVLLKMGRVAAALSAFEEALTTTPNPTTTTMRFLAALTSYPEHLSLDLYRYFNKLFRQKELAPPLAYFKLLSGIVHKL